MSKRFQHVIDPENVNEIILYKISILHHWNLVCLLHLKYLSIWTSPTSCTPWPRVARESCIGRHNCKAFGKPRKVNGKPVESSLKRRTLPISSNYLCQPPCPVHPFWRVVFSTIELILQVWGAVGWCWPAAVVGAVGLLERALERQPSNRRACSPSAALTQLLSPMGLT